MRSDYDDTLSGEQLHPETLMMGYGYRPEWSEGALKSPIFQTSTFVFESAAAGKAFFEVAYGLRHPGPGERSGLIYSRINNPDLEILEDRLTLWEEAEEALAFASGMAGIATTVLSYVRPGDVLLYSEPIYGGTDHLAAHVLPRFGIRSVSFGAHDDRATIEARLAAASAPLGMILIETPANPTNALIDIEMCAAIAARHRSPDRPVPLAVDNTFLGPLWQHPLQFGADLVLYSATKYIGGHSDVIAGACLGSQAMLAPVREMRTVLGTICNPWTGWLLLRSLETLKLRMSRQAENAARVAEFLVTHPKVGTVHYLGHLEAGDAQHDLYKRQCLGPGAMISFEVGADEAAAFRFADALELAKLAVSLGGTETLVEIPAAMTHIGVDPEHRLRHGVTDNLVRISVGVEHPDDIILDVARGLAEV